MSRARRLLSFGAPLLLVAACTGRGAVDEPAPEPGPAVAGAGALDVLAPWSALPALALRPSLELVDGAYRARFPGPAPARPVHVEIPAAAGEVLLLRDERSAVAMRVRPRAGSLPTVARAAEVVEGKVLYRHALGRGAHLVHAPLPGGSEELVVLESQASAGATLAWELELAGAAAGVRLVAGTVEVLDAGGAPRLRMARPWVQDAAGTRRWADVELGGCAHDTSPAPPWGRAPVPPGGPCTVTLRWDAAGLSYPLLVDPLWSTADSLGTPRGHHQATRLPDGRVLVTGGSSANYTDNAAYATAEIYDPGLDSWAATGSMAAARLEHVAALLPDGRVLVAGGRSSWNDGGLASAETFDPASGSFTATGSMGPGRAAARASALPSGKVLVTGGIDAGGAVLASAQTYDGDADAWAPAGSFVDARAHHTATTLVDGRVLVLGGHQNTPSSSADYPISASIYDEDVGGWQPVADWATSRGWHTATRLDNGRVVVIGGFIPSIFVALTDVYDPGTNTWSSGPNLPLARDQHTATLLGNGNVLVTGGEVTGPMPGVAYPTNDAWLLAADASAWGGTNPNAIHRYGHSATLLDDGRVLVVGGFVVDFDDYLAQADVEIYGLLPNGTPCVADGECNTAACRDGVCCDTACEGICSACNASLKGSGEDGVCGPIEVGADPEDECLDGGAEACMQNGLCDGAAACQLYDGGCVAKPCAEAAECASGVCSVDGICCDASCNGVCESCLGAVNGSMDGKCLPVLLGTDPDHECPSMSDSDCSAISLCNGALACAPSASLCEPYVCRDDTACRIGCDDDTHCVSTHRCDDGVCVVREPGCEGSVAVTADGTEIECSPYLCQADGSCRANCGSAADCAEGFVCGGTGECVTVSSSGDGGDDGGCGCRLIGVGGGVGGGAGAPPGREAAWLLVAALLLRRRRGCRAGGSRENIRPGGTGPS
jgi:hypothetical protein